MWSSWSDKFGISADLMCRLAVTVTAAAVVIVCGMLPVPSAEVAGADYYGLAKHPLTIGALGLVPFVVAYLLVEAVAVWRSAPDSDLGGVDGRPEWIGWVVVVVGFGIASLCALQIAMYWFSIVTAQFDGPVQLFTSTGTFVWLGTMVSVVAGSGLFYLLARWVSRSGLGDGFAVVLGTGIVWRVVPASRQFEDWLRGMSLHNLDVFGVLGNVLAVSAVILATLWVATRLESWVTAGSGAREGAGEGESEVRLGPRQCAATPFHAPAAGIVPFAVGTTLLWLLWLGRAVASSESLRFLGHGLETIPHAGSVPFFVQELAVVLVIGFGLGWYFTRRDLDYVDAPEAKTHRRRAQFASLVFLAFLVAVDVFGGPLVRSLGVVNLVLGTAIAYDLVREWKFRYAFEEVVPIRSLHRTGALGSVVDRLGEAGVPVCVRGRLFRNMLRTFGTFTPLVVFVPDSCVEAAESALGGGGDGPDGVD